VINIKPKPVAIALHIFFRVLLSQLAFFECYQELKIINIRFLIRLFRLTEFILSRFGLRRDTFLVLGGKIINASGQSLVIHIIKLRKCLPIFRRAGRRLQRFQDERVLVAFKLI
jgi:hypothetical protein